MTLNLSRKLKYLFVCLLFQCSFAWTDFWPLPNLDELDKKVIENFQSRFEKRQILPITFENEFINFQQNSFSNTYYDIANLALHWKLFESETTLSELRERINALCSYKTWGEIESQHSDLNRALPSILLSLVYSWLRKDLPSTELHALENRMHLALDQYWKEFQGESEGAWTKALNHPHYSLHLTAMVALSYSVVNRDTSLASDVMHHVRRSYSKYFRVMSDSEDGSLPQGLSMGTLTDLGILIFLENEKIEGRTKELESPWLKGRLPFYKSSVLPGQKELLNIGLGNTKPMVPIAPILWRWSDWFKDKELQYLADSCDKFMDEAWSPWAFLRPLLLHRNVPSYWNDKLEAHYFSEAGVWTARSGRRVQSSQLSFFCGNPFGKSIYKKVVGGYPDLALDWATPAQGSFTWYREGEHIFTHPSGDAREKTQNYNTLLINSAGQSFEGYPNTLPESLIESPIAGQLLEELRFGDSLLIRGEFQQCYPKALGLKMFDRTLIWLGESILVIVDQIETNKESELSLLHRSTQLEFFEHEQGFTQKKSGLSMKTWSEPVGEWTIAKDTLPNKAGPHFFAAHHVESKVWDRISIMAPNAWLKDFRSEHSDIKDVVDFSDGSYRIELNRNAGFDESWLMVKVRNKVFFNLKK